MCVRAEHWCHCRAVLLLLTGHSCSVCTRISFKAQWLVWRVDCYGDRLWHAQHHLRNRGLVCCILCVRCCVRAWLRVWLRARMCYGVVIVCALVTLANTGVHEQFTTCVLISYADQL